MKIKGQSLSVCRKEVLSWRSESVFACNMYRFHWSRIAKKLGGRWGCNMRVFYLGDTDEDEMLQVFIFKMTFQLS